MHAYMRPRRFSHVAHYINNKTLLTFWVALQGASCRLLELQRNQGIFRPTNRAFYPFSAPACLFVFSVWRNASGILTAFARLEMSIPTEHQHVCVFVELRGVDLPTCPSSDVKAPGLLFLFFLSFPFSICWAGYIYFLIYIVPGGFLF